MPPPRNDKPGTVRLLLSLLHGKGPFSSGSFSRPESLEVAGSELTTLKRGRTVHQQFLSQNNLRMLFFPPVRIMVVDLHSFCSIYDSVAAWRYRLYFLMFTKRIWIQKKFSQRPTSKPANPR